MVSLTIRYSVSVSYTHLDVYKRQGYVLVKEYSAILIKILKPKSVGSQDQYKKKNDFTEVKLRGDDILDRNKIYIKEFGKFSGRREVTNKNNLWEKS